MGTGLSLRQAWGQRGRSHGQRPPAATQRGLSAHCGLALGFQMSTEQPLPWGLPGSWEIYTPVHMLLRKPRRVGRQSVEARSVSGGRGACGVAG